MEFIAWMQSRLTAHGFSPGPIDGRMGPVTLAALKGFEKARGLPADGTADPKVVELLRAPSSRQAGAPGRDEAPEPAPVIRNVWPRQAAVPAFYGDVGRHQARVALPFDMKLAWDLKITVSSITLHEKVADSAARCFERIADAYDARARAELGLDLFGGSLNVRRMRGGSAWSMHSWGIAIDFDPVRNQLAWGRDRARLARPDALPFWRIWEEEGWVSLGREKNFDWMHIQAARL
jgi:hypothetical protein